MKGTRMEGLTLMLCAIFWNEQLTRSKKNRSFKN